MIRLNHLCMQVGGFKLDDINLDIPTGQYGVLMGKTGCGKTSIVEAICGLKPVFSGTIELAERDVTNMRPGERGLGFVPQDISLFGTLDVRQHLEFGPKVHNWKPQEIQESVDYIAEELGIEHLLRRRIHGLSGGEKQRVALGRALALRPKTLLLDEPLSALDEDTREQMCKLLKTIQEHTGVTTLHVTHSRQEAGRLADCVFRFSDGRVTREDDQVGKSQLRTDGRPS